MPMGADARSSAAASTLIGVRLFAPAGSGTPATRTVRARKPPSDPRGRSPLEANRSRNAEVVSRGRLDARVVRVQHPGSLVIEADIDRPIDIVGDGAPEERAGVEG